PARFKQILEKIFMTVFLYQVFAKMLVVVIHQRGAGNRRYPLYGCVEFPWLRFPATARLFCLIAPNAVTTRRRFEVKVRRIRILQKQHTLLGKREPKVIVFAVTAVIVDVISANLF